MNEKRSGAPGLAGVLETCVYYPRDARARIERFYAETLALDVVASWDDAFACRLPTGMLLVFDREALARREGPIAAHGSAGPGHVCLLADGVDAYEAWRERLRAAAVTITHEEHWGGAWRSFYFHDPAGNLLEIADGDMWPR